MCHMCQFYVGLCPMLGTVVMMMTMTMIKLFLFLKLFKLCSNMDLRSTDFRLRV
jgi:hypothetical protein